LALEEDLRSFVLFVLLATGLSLAKSFSSGGGIWSGGAKVAILMGLVLRLRMRPLSSELAGSERAFLVFLSTFRRFRLGLNEVSLSGFVEDFLAKIKTAPTARHITANAMTASMASGGSMINPPSTSASGSNPRCKVLLRLAQFEQPFKVFPLKSVRHSQRHC
jgi:hypothetical protein